MTKARVVIKIFDTKVGEIDIVDPENYNVMKRYITVCMNDVDIHDIVLPTCKEHRV